MPGFKWSERSRRELATVEPRLRAVMNRALALSPVDFGITEGRRSRARQVWLRATGKSRTLKSKHITGRAVDIVAYVGGKPCWDFEVYRRINVAVQRAARDYDTKVRWGGDWPKLRDAVHFELHDEGNP